MDESVIGSFQVNRDVTPEKATGIDSAFAKQLAFSFGFQFAGIK
ncbi:hypothetical protein [Marinobacterium nitratireducens]|nr:hypothetical protein [Marinobacterium nitratireducens]